MLAQLYNLKNGARLNVKTMRCSNDNSLMVCTVTRWSRLLIASVYHSVTSYSTTLIIPCVLYFPTGNFPLGNKKDLIVRDLGFKKIFGLSSANSTIRRSNVCAFQKWLSIILKQSMITQRQTTPSDFHQTRLQSCVSFPMTIATHKK